MSSLRPPLPPPLSHEGISFIVGSAGPSEVPCEVVSLIANALSAALPPGDFVTTSDGTLHFNGSQPLTSWQIASRLESTIRGTR